MTNKTSMYNDELVDQYEKIQEIVNYYQEIVVLINRYFVIDKVHEDDTFDENGLTYSMFLLTYRPNGLNNTRELLQKLPEFSTSDLAAVTITIENHLQIYRVLIQNLAKSQILLTDLETGAIEENVKDQKKELKNNIDSLEKQAQAIDNQLLLDCKNLEAQAPEKIIFAHAIADLNNIQGVDQNMIDQMKQLIVENHQTIANTQTIIDRAKKVNETLENTQKEG